MAYYGGGVEASKNIWNFDPTTIGGCTLWFDGADPNTLFSDTAGTTPATNGGTVAFWKDKSISANHATQSTLANRPVYNSGGFLQFTQASSHWLNITTPSALPTGASNGTYFVVTQRDPALTNTHAGIFSYGTNSTAGFRTIYDRAITGGTSLTGLIITLSGGNNPSTTNVVSNTAIHITSAVFDNYIVSGWYNGTIFTAAPVDPQNSNPPMNTGSTSAFIGASVTFSTFYGGNIYEILVFNTSLSNTDRQIVEGYLAAKWGLQTSLPASHPYYSTSLTNFRPTSVPNCALWLDAADSSTLFQDTAGTQPITTNNSIVRRVNDKSGNARNITTSNSTNTYTVSQLNGNSSVRVPSDSGFRTPSFAVSSTDSVSVFVVIQQSSTYTSNTAFIRNESGASTALRMQVEASFMRINTSGVGNSPSSMLTNLGNPNIYGVTFNSTTQISYLNGSSTGTLTGTSANTLNTADVYGIFTNTGPNGYLYEVLVYSTALTTTQRQQVEGYLAYKWGLQANLPSTHPYSSSIVLYNQIAPRPFSRYFTPPDIEGCNVWLDAADRTNVGLNATAWPDKSPSNISVSQATANDQPAYYPSKQAVYFGGNSTNRTRFTLGSVTPFLNTDLTIFIVERRESATGAIACGTGSSGGQNLIIKYDTSTAFQINFFDTGPNFSVPAFTSATQEPYRIWAITATASQRQIFLNGTAGTAQTGTLSRLTAWATATIGTFNGAGQPLYRGTIKEIIFYNSSLNTTNRQLIEGYLGWRWGLQGNLPSTHPYYSSNPSTNPLSVTGCILWLDGANVTTGTTVKALTDKSGQENDFTNVVSALSYSGTINNLPVVSPGSSLANSVLVSPSITKDTVNQTYFMVLKCISNASFSGFFPFLSGSDFVMAFAGSAPSAYALAIYLYLNPTLDLTTLGGGDRITAFTVGITGTYATANALYGGNTFIMCIVRQNGIWVVSVNGVVITSGSSTTWAGPNKSPVSYGISPWYSSTTAAQTAEVIVYNTALTQYQRQTVEGYLAWKWGLRTGVTSVASGYSLPTTHPFYRFPPPAVASIQPELQLYRKRFDPSDLSPVIWIDPQDSSSIVTDATTNRVRLMYNKGTAGLYTSASITSSSGTVLTLSAANAYLSVGQPVIFTTAPTGLTAGTTYFVFSYNSAGPTFEVTTTVGGASAVSGLSGSGFMLILPAFTYPLAGTGVGISGPLLSSSGTGVGNGIPFLDFSNGGHYQVTGATVGADLTTLTLTVSPAHNGSIPVGAFVNFIPMTGSYPGGASATANIGPFQILTATVSGGTTLTITTLSAHGIGNSQSVFLTINTGTFLGGADASGLTGAYTTAASGNTGTTIVLTIPSSTNGLMAISDGHVRNNVGTSGPYITQAGTTGSTVVLTSYSARASAGALTGLTGRIEYGSIPITSGVLTSTTSLTVRTPINHGLSSGASIGIGFSNNFSLPFQSSINTSGTTINQAAIQFTNAVVSGNTTLTITVASNPFYLTLAGVNTYTGITTAMRLTLLDGAQFSDGTSATGLTANNYTIQAGSNATTIVFTIASSPNGALNFTGLPGMVDSGSNIVSPNLNSTQTTSVGTSGNTIVVPIPTFTTATTGTLLRVRNTTPYSFPSDDANVTFTSIFYPVNGYALENISLGNTSSGALVSSRVTVIWVSHYARTPYRTASTQARSMAIATATSANGAGGNLTTDYSLISALFGAASRHAILYNNGVGNSLTVSVDTTSNFRIHTMIFNLTSTATADIPAYSAGTINLGWRNENNLFNSNYSGLAGSYSPATLTPVHFRLGGNTNATNNYTTYPLTTSWYEGGIGDVMVFNSVLSVEQRQLVEGYLAQKYACQAYLGGTTSTANTASAAYTITSGSAFGASAPYIIALGGTFSPALINTTQVTVSGATPSGLNGTWTLRSSNTTQITFYSQTSLAWTSGGTISGITTNNASFIHPYRLNPNNITSGLSLSNNYAQGLVTWIDAANRSTLSFVSGNLISSWAAGGTLGVSLVAPSISNTVWNPTYVLDSVGRPNVKFTRASYSITTKSVDASNGILITSTSVVPAVEQAITFNSAIAPNITAGPAYYIRTVTFVSGNDYTITVSSTIGGTALTLTQNSSLVVAGTIRTANTLAQTSGSFNMGPILTTQTLNNEFTSVLVFSRDGGSTGGIIVGYIASGNTRITMEDTTRTCDYNLIGVSALTQPITYTPSTSPLAVNVPYILIYSRRGAQSFTRLIGNGTFLGTSVTNTKNLVLSSSGVTLRVGGYASPDAFSSFAGSIYEHMLFKYALTDQAIYQIEGYLAWKWGLQTSLPTTHPYYRVRP